MRRKTGTIIGSLTLRPAPRPAQATHHALRTQFALTASARWPAPAVTAMTTVWGTAAIATILNALSLMTHASSRLTAATASSVLAGSAKTANA